MPAAGARHSICGCHHLLLLIEAPSKAVGVTCVHPPCRQRFPPADYLPQARRSPKPLRERAMPSIPEQQQSSAPSDGAGTKEAAGAVAASSSAGFAAVDGAQASFGASERAGLRPAEHGSSAGGWVPCTASLTASARSTLCIVSAVLGVHHPGEQHVTAVQHLQGTCRRMVKSTDPIHISTGHLLFCGRCDHC